MKIKEYEIKHKRKIQEIENKFVEEFSIENPDFVRERRLEFLKDELIILEKNNDDLLKVGGKAFDIKWFLDFVKSYIKKNNKEIKKIKFEIEAYEKVELNNKDTLTDEEIERAHTADCSQFVNIKRKSGKHSFALCPFHQEKTPSFCCFEGGGYKCFGCGEAGDAIDLMMKIFDLDFKEAVKKLQI